MRSETKSLNLSSREEEILVLASQGPTDRQIATEVGIRSGTINTHWSRIRLKLGAATRSEAVAILLKAKSAEETRRVEKDRDEYRKMLQAREQDDFQQRETAEQIKAILGALPQMYWVMAPDGNVFLAEGQALSGLTGSSTEMDERADFVRSVVPEAELRRALEGRKLTLTQEFKDRAFESQIIPIPNQSGMIDFVVGVTTDVTFQKAAFETLLASQRLLSSIIAASPSLVAVHDLDDNAVVFANQTLSDVVGLSTRELHALGAEYWNVTVHPEDRKRVLETFDSMREAVDGDAKTVDLRIRHRDGSFVLARKKFTVLKRHEDGKVKEVLGVALIL